MRQATPEFHDLARRLLAHETGGQQSVIALEAASQRACQKLHQQLAKLIGPAGFNMCFVRAMHLAAAEFPFLKSVRMEAQSERCLTGLRESVEAQDPGEATRAMAALLASFLWLLSSFIGEDMTLRQVRRVWPEFPGGELRSGQKEERG